MRASASQPYGPITSIIKTRPWDAAVVWMQSMALAATLMALWKPKGYIGSPEVIIDRLRKGYHIQAFLPQEIGCFLASVSAQHHQTFQF